MVDFRRALNEINVIRNIVIMLMCFLDAAIFFLCLFLFLLLINLYPMMAIIPAFFYFLLKSYNEINSKKLIEVEKKHPILWERLRTAADTVNTDSFIVMRLRASIIKNLRLIGISSFFNFKEIRKKVGYISLFSFLIIIISIYGLHIIDMEAVLNDVDFGKSLKEKLLGEYIPKTLLMFGIDVNDLNRDQEIGDINNQMNMRDRLPEESFSTGLPSELFKGSDVSFEETMSKKKRIYIRNYFGKIRDYE